jgi:uncharacterized phage protein (TIGR02218 family)
MKSASAGLISRLALSVQSLCYLCTVTRKDGEVVRLNDSVEDVIVSGDTYIAAPGFSITSVTSASYGQPASADIDLPITSTGPITPAALEAGYFDEAAVLIEIVDYLSLTDGTLNIFRGKISQIEKTDQNQATVRLQGFSADLLELIVETYGPDCRAPYLGHSRCGFDVSTLTRTATVATVIDERNFTITVTEPLAVDGWFANGAVQFTSGTNDGLAFDIRAWTQSTALVSLWFAPYGVVEVGDTLNIAPGCDFTTTMCNAKFSNILNFQGFPFLPTDSQMVCGTRSLDDPGETRPPVGSTVTVIC